MKNQLRISSLLTVIATLLITNISFAGNGRDTSNCLWLNGKVTKSSLKEKGNYTIELIKEDKVINSQTVSSKKEFNFDLAKNSEYTLRISKDGFIPFVISIDTELAEENNELYNFRFETELVPLSMATNYQKKNQDKPKGILKFDADNNGFSPVEYWKCVVVRNTYLPIIGIQEA